MNVDGIGLNDKHFIMLTFEANKEIADIHHRMPVLLDEKTREMWLDPNKSFAECYKAIIESDIICDGNKIEMVEVGPLVNKVVNQSADCILSKAEYDQK